jgi:predicted transcriptional regulator
MYMDTRVNITVSRNVKKALQDLAKERRQTVSRVGAEMIEAGLQYNQEWLLMCALNAAEQRALHREAKEGDEIWKALGLI